MKDLDALIDKLSRDAQPVRSARLTPLFASWFLGIGLYVGLLLLFIFKPRPDLAQKLGEPLFMAEIASLILLIAATSLSATVLSFPDQWQRSWAVSPPLGALALFIFVIILEWLADYPPSPKPEHSIECSLAIIAASALPALWMFIRIRHMAPVHLKLAGSVALLAAFAIGALALRLSEMTNSIDHVIIWHYLPMIGIGIAGLAVGQRFFKW